MNPDDERIDCESTEVELIERRRDRDRRRARRVRPAPQPPSAVDQVAAMAESLAFANLALATSQSLAHAFLDMPGRAQADNVVRLATSARAAVQIFSGCQDRSVPERDCRASPY